MREVFNPLGVAEEKLPVIYGFVDVWSSLDGGKTTAYAITDDGQVLKEYIGHVEDLVLAQVGVSPSRQVVPFKDIYPGGYVLESIPSGAVKTHRGLLKAVRLVFPPDPSARERAEKMWGITS